MKTTFKLSALALVIALTACGSSSGGSSPANFTEVENKAQSSQATNQTGNSQPQTATTENDSQADSSSANAAQEKTSPTDSQTNTSPTTTQSDSPNTTTDETQQQRTYRSGQGGAYGVFDDTIDNEKFNNGFFDDTNTINGTTLVVDGVTYKLADYPNQNSQPLSHSVFGYAWKDVTDGKDIVSVYANGTLTEADKVPTSGTFAYKGDAFAYSELQGDMVNATASLQVDFAAKTVNGQISNAAYNLTETFPTAKIDGNEFFGSSENKQVRGNFFGTNVEEVSGIYRNSSAVAAFGATKQ